MTLDEKRAALQKQLTNQEMPAKDERIAQALGELCYTASETGVLPFVLTGEALYTMIYLVRLAYKCSNGIPDNLRM